MHKLARLVCCLLRRPAIEVTAMITLQGLRHMRSGEDAKNFIAD